MYIQKEVNTTLQPTNEELARSYTTVELELSQSQPLTNETLSLNAGHGQLVTCCDSLTVPISCQDQTVQCSVGVINSAA